MRIDDEPLPAGALGPRIAAGRDTAIHALGADRIVRRAGDHRSYVAEAELMDHVQRAGYPVPRVFRVAPGEMELERIAGPTMGGDLMRHPWRIRRHARTLADLHLRLHRIPPPPRLRAGPVPGDAIVHLDLHPLNVILSPCGPVVIDWTNGAQADGAVDLALTWLVMAVFEADVPGPLRPFAGPFRRRLTDLFLAFAGRDDARRVLGETAAYRKRDRAVRPSEAAAIDRLVARELGAANRG